MKVVLKHSENLHFTASARQFNDIHIDEPESFHGTDKGPSSVEFFLIGIGGCIGSTFTYCLQKKDVKIDDLEIIVDGQLKHTGPKMHLRLVNVEIELILTVARDKSSEKVEECMKTFQEYCIVSNSLNRDLRMDIKVLRK